MRNVKKINVNSPPRCPAEDNVDVPYKLITDVDYVGRGFGGWGDMVITLKDGSKTELRSVEKYKEVGLSHTTYQQLYVFIRP